MAYKRYYVSLDKLSVFLDNLKKTFADIDHEHKKNVITNITSPLTLEDGSEYYLTNISTLEILYPENNFEVWMNISFSSTENISIIFPVGTQYIGAEPTFNKGETWEISIKNKTAICWRIES